MKKKLILFLLLVMFLLVGCENIQNTPTSKVESFFANYQKLDSMVLKELDNTVEKEENLTKEQKEKYKTLFEKQYQNLSYKIVDEEIIENQAMVNVEIEVFDYKNAIKKAEEYYVDHQEEFSEDEDYWDYKIKEMQKVVDRINYKITIYLEKEEGLWEISDLTVDDREKIHGLY